jgi:hypothetical protein
MLLACLALAVLAPDTKLELTPIDDVWVYTHSSSPGTDPFLRVWGVGGRAVPSDAAMADEYSMGYLRWTLGGVPRNQTLKSAELVVFHAANPGFTLEQAKKAPLEARTLRSTFDERTWNYEKIADLLPPTAKEAVYGTGTPQTLEGDAIPIRIDLMKGPADFRAALKAAGDSMAIALTSTLDMSELGRTGIYRVHSKDDRDPAVRPKLILVFE